MRPGTQALSSMLSVVLLAGLNACAQGTPVQAVPVSPAGQCPGGATNAASSQRHRQAQLPIRRRRSLGDLTIMPLPKAIRKEKKTVANSRAAVLAIVSLVLGRSEGFDRLVKAYKRPSFPDQPPQHSAQYNAMKTFVEKFLRDLKGIKELDPGRDFDGVYLDDSSINAAADGISTSS